MRIPFDLIAAVLSLVGIEEYYRSLGVKSLDAPMLPAVLAFAGFFLVTWLLNELLTRFIEWRIRFGAAPEGLGKQRHPLVVYTWGLRLVQTLTVGFFALVVWALVWPVRVGNWPAWVGLSGHAHLWHLRLADSSLATMSLELLPFLIAMVLSWIPRRRLVARLQRRYVPLGGFLAQEMRLTWIPLILWLALACVADFVEMLPREETQWLNTPGLDLLLLLGGLAFLAAVVLPKLIVWWWRCTPIPDGPLRNTLEILMRRSGIRARQIMFWGPRNSNLLNACVLGPWAPFRYVLISPQLIEELTPEETLAVMAHELGHARHGHLTLLFVLLLALSLVLDPLTQLLAAHSPLLQAGLTIVLMILYIWGFSAR